MNKVEFLCGRCGGATFERSGRVAIGNKQGQPSEYTRRVCKKGCGWVSEMNLEDGSKFKLPQSEPEKTKV